MLYKTRPTGPGMQGSLKAGYETIYLFFIL